MLYTVALQIRQEEICIYTFIITYFLYAAGGMVLLRRYITLNWKMEKGTLRPWPHPSGGLVTPSREEPEDVSGGSNTTVCCRVLDVRGSHLAVCPEDNFQRLYIVVLFKFYQVGCFTGQLVCRVPCAAFPVVSIVWLFSRCFHR